MDQSRVEDMLLAFFGNLAESGITDRRSAGAERGGIDHRLGLANSANDLASRTAEVGGTQLALEYYLVPRSFAAGMLRREVVNPEGDREAISLVTVPEAEWTQVERDAVVELTYRVKLAAHRMAERAGWINVRPLGWDGKPMEPGQDGLCTLVMVTPRGLAAARKLVQARADLRWRRLTPEADFGRVAWQQAPDWAKDRYAHNWGRDPVPVN